MVVCGLMNSSCSRMVWSRKSFTGTTEPAKKPPSRALRGALLRFPCAKASTSSRREAFQRGDQVGADALRHEGGGRVGFRVLRPGAAVGADRHAAHAFHAAGHHQVFPARAHLLRRHVHGLQAGGAEAVELHAGAAEVPAGLQRRDLGDHRALLADRRDHAHHHVVDLAGVEVVAPLQFGQHAGQQVDGLDLVQAAVLLALAARGADGVVNIGFGHDVLQAGLQKASIFISPSTRSVKMATAEGETR